MSSTTFLLASGRSVHVHALLVEETGVQASAPLRELDVPGRFAAALAGLEAAARRVRPELPLLVLGEWAQPPAAPPGRTHPGRWTCIAWLGSAPVDAGRDGSELLVGWLADEVPDIAAAIAAATAALDWDAHARDFTL